MLWLLQTVKNETIWIEKAIVFHIVRKPLWLLLLSFMAVGELQQVEAGLDEWRVECAQQLKLQEA
jgi:hypothetical protein